MMDLLRRPILMLASIACTSLGSAHAVLQAEEVCGQPRETATIAKVRGMEQITLADGRTVRLAAIEPPHARPSPGRGARAIERAADTLLQDSLVGSKVTLSGTKTPDRHGRLVVQVATEDGSWIQKMLVAQGLVRVMPLVGQTDCVGELLAAEANARARGQGLWALSEFAPRSAEGTRALLERLDRYEIVAGTIRDVSSTKRLTYLNFGDDWRTDFTVALTADAREDLERRGFTMESLAGRPIRVRGFIERRNGPMVTVDVAEQVEFVPKQ
ncbi:endonuclease YncB(thermonuclease family) [Rhodoligotrophos appendicifer]|uniref:thermonuclease family protein n=1 Tax=Rhodoligotrophos appendicifer TaxID=987056 RepID=UPI00117D6591|nr:thermonuclease family protein [Rhodoligotrophos appendicifer]